MKGGKKTPGSGRKAGTPNKATADVKALAGVYIPRVITMLAAIVESESAPLMAKVAAGRELLDRGCGKPAQALTGPEGGPLIMKQVIHQQLQDDAD
jgi:hypothetical protein